MRRGTTSIRQVFHLIFLPVILLVVLMAGGFYLITRSRVMMERQIMQQLQGTAAMAALQFSGEEIATIKSAEDMRTPAYASVVKRLQNIRAQTPYIRFAYILRRTDIPTILRFVADADALLSTEELDRNSNGVLDPEEEPSLLGDAYDISTIEALQNRAFVQPTADSVVTFDQWGKLISGYAPIRGANGIVVAVLGIDMEASTFVAMSQSVFSPILILLMTIAALVLSTLLGWEIWYRRHESLKQLEAERSALMDLASHQLGAPITTFKWWLEILKERDHGRICKEGDVCNQLQEGINRIDAIMLALRNADLLREGKLGYSPKDASLNALVLKVASTMKVQLKHRKQTLTLQLAKDLPSVSFDAKLIAGVVQELCDNASAYSPEGSTITVRTRVHRQMAEVSVQDQGCGISAKDMDHMFEKFRRGTCAMRLRPVGNGLGLYIAHGIVEQAGGRMHVQSSDGKGSTFIFTLPLRS